MNRPPWLTDKKISCIQSYFETIILKPLTQWFRLKIYKLQKGRHCLQTRQSERHIFLSRKNKFGQFKWYIYYSTVYTYLQNSVYIALYNIHKVKASLLIIVCLMIQKNFRTLIFSHGFQGHIDRTLSRVTERDIKEWIYV